MGCQACSEEIPDDSIFCPECGARQDLSKAGGRTFGVVSPQAVQAGNEPEEGGAATQAMDVDTLNRLAFQMKGDAPQDTPAEPTAESNDLAAAFGSAVSGTNEIVDRVNVAEKEQKSSARNEWLEMNHQTATDVLSQVNSELPTHLRQDDSGGGAARFLEEALGEDAGPEDVPAVGLLRRMAEVAVRRVARKRGVAVESPQVAVDGDLVRVNVTYIDDGRVLDTPQDLSNAFSHAISTEVALKGLEISISVSLFASKEGEVSHVWGDAPEEDTPEEDEEEKFACEACSHYPVMDSDPACPNCGAVFEDDGDDDGPTGGPPSRSEHPGPPSGPRRGAPSGPRRGGPSGPSRGGPSGGPSGGPPGGGPPSRGAPPSRGGGPSSTPPKRGPGGPPSRGGPKKGGPPSGPKKGGPPGGPKRRPPR